LRDTLQEGITWSILGLNVVFFTFVIIMMMKNVRTLILRWWKANVSSRTASKTNIASDSNLSAAALRSRNNADSEAILIAPSSPKGLQLFRKKAEPKDKPDESSTSVEMSSIDWEAKTKSVRVESVRVEAKQNLPGIEKLNPLLLGK
jgi:Na+-transporting methylmalonyl-CoA/oxaloacetate decarboxylase gamma subunit